MEGKYEMILFAPYLCSCWTSILQKGNVNLLLCNFIILFMVGKSNKNTKRVNKSRQTDPIQAASDYG